MSRLTNCNVEQVERAAGLRFEKSPWDSDREVLNKIIHSSDKPTKRNDYQRNNEYFDLEKKFDPRAQKELDRIGRK